MLKFFVSVLLIFSLALSVYGLNRDYFTVYEDSDGRVHYDGLNYLDEYEDRYGIYCYDCCIDHFNKSYLPRWKTLTLDQCLP